MVNKARVIGEPCNIDPQKAKEFWNKRAEKYDPENPHTTVRCNDNNQKIIDDIEIYEKERIYPLLKIDNRQNVLDIGCGIGRLAEIFVPLSRFYVGVDYAEDLIKIANSRIDMKYQNYSFAVSDFNSVTNVDCVIKNSLYQRVIICGVGMYINDKDLLEGFKSLLPILDSHCLIYFSGPIAIESRLTLNNYQSVELKSEYSAIYRTDDEYLELFSPLLQEGFTITHNQFYDGNFSQFKETARHFYILER